MGHDNRAIQFIGLTYLITWSCWGAIIISNKFGYLPYGTGVSMLLFLVGGNGVPIAAYVTQKKWNEIKGFKDFIKRNFSLGYSRSMLFLVAVFVMMHFSALTIFSEYNKILPLYAGILLIPVNMVGGGFEEIGWRGVLQPLIRKRFSSMSSIVIISTVWSLWHLPLWFIEGTYQADISFLYFTVSVFGFTALLGAIYEKSKNVFLCILFHATVNSFMGVFMPIQGMGTIVTALLELLIGWRIMKGMKINRVGE